MMECNCGGVQEIAAPPAGIKGTVTYGNHLKALVCVLSTKGMVAMKNLCEIIEGLSGIKLSVGTVSNMLHSAAEMAKPIVDNFPQKLLQKPVVHCDETGLRVNGKLYYVHVICTPGLTYYALSEKRGTKAMEEIGATVISCEIGTCEIESFEDTDLIRDTIERIGFDLVSIEA